MVVYESLKNGCTIQVHHLITFPPKKSKSTGVDFRRLPDNESLATCKFVLCATETILFRGIAKIEDDKGIIRVNAISVYRFLFWKLHF